jgi:hypothetical protein
VNAVFGVLKNRRCPSIVSKHCAVHRHQHGLDQQ